MIRMETSALADLDEFLNRVKTGCTGRVWECGQIWGDAYCPRMLTNDPDQSAGYCHQHLRGFARTFGADTCGHMLLRCVCGRQPYCVADFGCMAPPDAQQAPD